MEANAVETVSGVIQLSVAPVFLLAVTAGMISVLSERLGRVVKTRLLSETHGEHRTALQSEIAGLWKRTRPMI